MLGRNHALSGAFGFAVTAPMVLDELDLATVVAGTLLCAGAALAPDLDHPGSTVSRSAGPVSRVAAVGVRAASGGHRQGTHSLMFAALACAASLWLVHEAPLTAAAAVAGFLVAVAAPLIGKHVGITVGVPAGLVLGGGLYWTIANGQVALGDWYVLAITLGVLLHALGDLLTPQGVPLLWPFAKVRFRVPLFTTGSPVEGIVGAAMLVGFILAAPGLVSG